jgi:GNAT superfamily N-acetyltransferase
MVTSNFYVEEDNSYPVLVEALSLAEAHYYEVESKSDKVPFRLDVNLLGEYVKLGLLYVIVARDEEGAMIGYFANLISADPITSKPVGKELGIYVKPEWRNSNVMREMLRIVEEGARDRKAYCQLLAFKEGHDEGIAFKFGYEPTEITYQKVFEVSDGSSN